MVVGSVDGDYDAIGGCGGHDGSSDGVNATIVVIFSSGLGCQRRVAVVLLEVAVRWW